MSSIDRRVVEMEFDNKQFEKGIKETLDSLEALKKGLQLEGATKGLTEIEAAASKGAGLGEMASALENISSKFNVMGAIGFAVIQRLTNAAIDFGKKIASTVMGPLIEGGRRRALNIEQAKFMFRGLGMDIEATMANALEAVTGTAFGLDEAAKAASMFGASGMRAGDEMTSALRGIAGVAAMTASSYDDIANVFTKVAGNGRLMGDDLLRMSSRGLNAAATLGEAFDKTEAEIREMVTAGEVSFEMFYTAMDQAFGENATKANETYAGSLANVRAALSRIGATFFTPWLEQQRDLFNALSPAIDGVHDALKPVIAQLIGFTGRGTEGLIAVLEGFDSSRLALVFEPLSGIISNLYRLAKSILGPIREAFLQIFPPASLEQINSILVAIENFTDRIKMGVESSENLRRTFAGVFAVFSIGWSVVKAFATFLFDLFGMVEFGSGGFLAATANIGDFLVALDQAIKNGEGLTNFFKGLASVLVGPIELLRRLGQALLSVFDFEAPNVEKMTLSLEPLGRLGHFILNIWDHVLSSMGRVWAVFAPLADRFSSFFGRIGDAIQETFGGLDFADVLDTIRTFLMGGLLLTFRRFVKNLGSGMNTFSSKMTKPFQQLTWTLSTMQNTLRAMTLMQIAIAVALLATAVVQLSKVDGAGLTKALSAISVMFIQLMAGLKAFTLMGGTTGLVSTGLGLIFFATALRILTSSVKALSELSWEELAKGLSAVTVLIGGLVVAARGMATGAPGMIKAGVGLMAISVAIKILASAVKDISDLGWEEIAKGLVGVGGLLAALVIFTRLVAVNKGGLAQGAGLVLLATGIKILASAAEDFAGLSWEQIGKGLVSIGALLLGFAGFSHIINPTALIRTGTSLILVGTAMNILARAMERFGNLSWEQIAKGLASMGASLLIIAGAMRLMPKSTIGSAVAIGIIALSLGKIASALQDFGGMSWEEIAKGLVTLAGALGIIALAMMGMTGALAGAAATLVVATALRMLVPVLQTLGTMSLAEIARGLGTLALVFGTLGVAALILAPVVPALLGLGAAVALLGAGMMLAGAGVLAFSVGLTALAAAGGAGVAAIVAIVAGLVGLLPTVAKQLGIFLIVFAETIAAGGPAILKAITTVLEALIKAVKDNLPNIIDLLSDMLDNFLDLMIEFIPKIVSAGLQIMVGIYEAMNEYVPVIVALMISLVVAILEELTAGVPGMVQAAIALMVAFLQAIADDLGDVITAGTNILIALVEGISENSVRIVDAGMKAVVDFINGVANAIRDRSGELEEAGWNLASAIIGGMVRGLTNLASRVTGAIGRLVRGAISRAERDLETGSPSKVFEEIGEWVGEGFVNGLIGSAEAVENTWDAMTHLTERAIDDSIREIERLHFELEQLNEAREKDVEAIRETEAALAAAQNEYGRSVAGFNAMTSGLLSQREELEKLGAEYDIYTQKLDDANQKLQDAIKTRDDYNASIQRQYSQLPNLNQDTGLEDYINQLEYANADIVKFAEILQELRKMGLSDAMYEEFLSAGPDILPFLEELHAGGKKSVKIINDLSSDLAKSAKKLGKTASKELYQAGVDAIQGLVNGLESKRAAVEATMAAIAASIKAVLELQMQLKSPSRVMRKLGEFVIKGLANGMERAGSLVDKAASGVGKDAISAMKKSIAGLSDILDSEMDLNPKITPVLDLSSVDKDAQKIEKLLTNQKIGLDAAYLEAKYVASAYQKNRDAQRDMATPVDTSPEPSVVYNQYNTSPKALSSAEIYRQTKNQLSKTKGDLIPDAT